MYTCIFALILTKKKKKKKTETNFTREGSSDQPPSELSTFNIGANLRGVYGVPPLPLEILDPAMG